MSAITGAARAELNSLRSDLKKIGLLEEYNAFVDYSRFTPAFVRAMDYRQEFEYYERERLFDFRLKDFGLLQYKMADEDDVSFCYYPSPLDVPSYDGFSS